jgi:hypothetical protein
MKWRRLLHIYWLYAAIILIAILAAYSYTNKEGFSNTQKTISFITYGNDKFRESKERIVNEARDMGCFNGIIKAYNPDDLSEDFKTAVGDVLNESRGGGYWIWKPYIIADALSQINENDILIYADAGSKFNKKGMQRLMEYINMISPESGYSVLVMRWRGLKNHHWTTTRIFDEFNVATDGEIANSSQVLATVQIYRKCKESVNLINKWIEIAETRPDLFTDRYNEETKGINQEFVDNRHDQSIFSMIVHLEPYSKTCKVIDEEIEHDTGSNPIFAARKRL